MIILFQAECTLSYLNPSNWRIEMTRKRKKFWSRDESFGYDRLERRELLASVSIQDVNGRETLLIDGCNQSDVAVVDDLNANQVRLTLNGQVQNFDKSDFVRIRFLGRDGNDRFTNNTDIDSAAFGHAGNDVLQGGNGHNWMQGGDGDDTLTGGDKNDLLRGRAGNDTIDGGRRHDRLFGADGNDSIVGGSGNDVIRGDRGADQIFSLNGNDRVLGADGNDFIQTGDGDDTVQYTGAYSDYTIFGDTVLTVRADIGNEGTDQVEGAEWYQFSNVTLSATQAPTANLRVTIRPIVVSNDDGSNTAEFFGNESQEQDIKQRIDELYSQANIDIFFENERMWNDSFANIGNGGTRPQSDLNTIVQNGDNEGVGSPNSLVIDIYFVEVVPGFSDTGEFTGNGLAFIDGSGIAVHIGDNLVNSEIGRDIVSRVVAHEVGHNLGLPHINDTSNLMHEDGAGTLLTQGQINSIQNSDFALPI